MKTLVINLYSEACSYYSAWLDLCSVRQDLY